MGVEKTGFCLSGRKWTCPLTTGVSVQRAPIIYRLDVVSFLNSLRRKSFRLVSGGVKSKDRGTGFSVFEPRHSFFAPKPYGNACYAGYFIKKVVNFCFPVSALISVLSLAARFIQWFF